MRNSFNISGFSEAAHEIRDDPREAQYHYSVRSTFSPTRGVIAHTEPALLGSVKSARKFTIPVSTPAAMGISMENPEDPTPLDLALTGIAACSLKTMVGGGTARGITFGSLSMTISAGLDGGHGSTSLDAPIAGISCRIHADDSVGGSVLDELVSQVRSHSPNHRTVTDPIPVLLDIGRPPHDSVVPGPVTTHLVTAGQRAQARRVRWVSSTQFESIGENDEPSSVLRVDQPKQLTGVDWGPNPQEYLLMALAAEVALQTRQEALRRTRSEGVWEVHAKARVDIRGLLKLDPTAPVPIQDLVCAVRPRHALPEEEWRDIARAAVRRSVLVDLLTNPCSMKIDLICGVPV